MFKNQMQLWHAIGLAVIRVSLFTYFIMNSQVHKSLQN